jgi:steroid delta-isomerase-like uncharacterized protein
MTILRWFSAARSVHAARVLFLFRVGLGPVFWAHTYAKLFLLTLMIGCTSARPPIAHDARSVDEQRHEAIVRRYFGEVWSEGRLDVLDQLLTEDYVNHTPSTPNPPPGPAGLKPIVAAFRQAFPDLHFTVEDVIVEGDRVAARVRMQGTHTGPLFGIAPTRRRVSVEQVNVELFRGGRIAEHWRVTDELGLLRQLGVIE